MIKACLVCVGASILMVGCTGIKEVKAWEKEGLAKEIMQFEGPNPELKKFEQHLYFSKEASRGGYGVAGGGCGCN
ncbi:MAG: Phosphonate ABC transporter phosphate-binding periplasmic component (TC 3.A.1.9.1) [uncultured Sulfurovum sp.]|uniref:Phosphonate ABC transporter phosphate-binding periplasmic component (TC 3.A.1.9.1) n=1 Tax=uncultured Sulfurovum sp. TaxID=269237 RepID=A0A6S6SUT4_9BACT|nr:MAG: Phosphonate ABC transporter phosphate-binding periplasmic component (TC 3.A.1.9.1) [uncultured Sulfurovum sp.]